MANPGDDPDANPSWKGPIGPINGGQHTGSDCRKREEIAWIMTGLHVQQSFQPVVGRPTQGDHLAVDRPIDAFSLTSPVSAYVPNSDHDQLTSRQR